MTVNHRAANKPPPLPTRLYATIQEAAAEAAEKLRFRPLGPGDCISCHYGEFSRPFEWDKFWPGIAHGKDVPDGK